MLKLISFAVCGVAILLFSHSEAIQYQITEISDANHVDVWDINDNGVVLGSHFIDKDIYKVKMEIGFVWNNLQGLREFGIGLSGDFRVDDINNLDNVVFTQNSITYIWHQDKGYAPICRNLDNVFININNNAIGYHDLAKDDDIKFEDIQEDGLVFKNYMDFLTIYKDSRVVLRGINDNNNTLAEWKADFNRSWSICDLEGHLLKLVAIKDSPYPEQCDAVHAYALNNLNDVVGREIYAEFNMSVLWTGDGQRIEIQKSFYNVPYDVNDNRQVVGILSDHYWNERAFVWSQELGLQDLNECIPVDSGWELKEAIAINNKGQIVGIGKNKNNSRAAFLLTPIAE